LRVCFDVKYNKDGKGTKTNKNKKKNSNIEDFKFSQKNG